MSEREIVREAFMDSASEKDVYIRKRRIVDQAIYAYIEPGAGVMSLHDLPCNVSRELDDGSATTFAALLAGAFAHRGHLYLDRHTEKVSYGEIWSGTPLSRMADRCQEIVRDVTPHTTGRYSYFDKGNYEKDFNTRVQQGGVENVIFTGLNGAGKTTVLSAAKSYLQYCGLSVEVTKFPQENGPLSETIKDILKGNIPFNSDALQYLMMADALNCALTQGADADIQLFDRHPLSDGPVFASQNMQPSLFVAHEMFNNPSWIFIIDRHPAAAVESVLNRETSPRIFEGKLERAVEQTINLLALSALPGVRIINNDIPLGSGEHPEIERIKLSKTRTLGALITSGIVARALQRKKICPNDYAAQEYAREIYIQNMDTILNRE